jgi:DNA-directed RNA polymerase specialized sigma24 family protein
LWKRFFPQLVRVAHHKLRSAQGGKNDEEDIALLSQLPPPLQQLTLAKLEGYTNEEIAQQSSCSLRSVERQLRLIREMWSQEIPRA